MAEDLLTQLKDALVEGNETKTLDLTKHAMRDGLTGQQILQNGLVPAMRTVGELFNEGEYFLPELMVSGKIMSSAVDLLESTMGKEARSNQGKFLIGSVKGDIHDIGKNIVIMMLKSNGWKVTDLGVDVSPERFCAAVKDGDFDILGMSSLLTMALPHANATIKALDDAGLRDRIKVIIGGAPVTQEFADEIGADAYGRDAWDAVLKAEALLKTGQ